MKPCFTLLFIFAAVQITQAQFPTVWGSKKYQNGRLVDEKYKMLKPDEEPENEQTPVRYSGSSPCLFISDTLPAFPGGIDSLMIFLIKELKYSAECACYEGRVIFRFTVNPDGKLSDFELMRKSCPKLDEEVLRVARLMPDWIPGKRNGIPIAAKMIIPLRIRLER